MTKKRLAAIDIGTNSIRCLIVEPTSNGKFRVLDDEKATVRLGEGLAQTGKISPQAWDRGIETLLRMRKIIDSYQVRGIEAVATSAVRKADNGRDFISAVARETGLAITVIGGEEEAELAAMSVRNNFEMEGIHYGMLDIGGGSLEIITAFGGHIEQILSLDLGTVFLTEKFLHTDPVNPKEYKRLRKHIRAALRDAFAEGMPPMQCLVGSGGSITSIAAMVVAMGREEYESVHGYELLRSQVVHLLAMLLRKDLKGRRAVPGLHPDRADIIIAGVAVVDELMKLLDVNVLRVNERGIREGLILRGLRKHGLIAEPSAPRTWRSSVTEFARSCHFDEEHSLQVAKLAVMIFDSLAPEYGLTRRHRQILEAAAILHDTGYLISYSGHHKHSYLLIRHADLFGFTPREKEIMANAARYHRKGLPKKKHKAYDRLAAADQELVRKLGGILRLADGLDRRRNSHLRHLECSLEEGRMTIAVRDCDDVSVELFGGKMKSDLFEEAFSRKLLLRHAVQ